jgi:hypothetical protein
VFSRAGTFLRAHDVFPGRAEIVLRQNVAISRVFCAPDGNFFAERTRQDQSHDVAHHTYGGVRPDHLLKQAQNESGVTVQTPLDGKVDASSINRSITSQNASSSLSSSAKAASPDNKLALQGV